MDIMGLPCGCIVDWDCRPIVATMCPELKRLVDHLEYVYREVAATNPCWRDSWSYQAFGHTDYFKTREAIHSHTYDQVNEIQWQETLAAGCYPEHAHLTYKQVGS